MRGLAAVAVALPAVLCTALVVAFELAELGGSTPLSYGRPRNIAEAAAMGNAAELLRLLGAGEDHAQLLPVRPEIISPLVTRLTAIEAAVLSGKVELIALADRRGLIAGPQVRGDLHCLARDVDAEAIADYLGPFQCEPGVARARILARTAADGRTVE